MVEIKQGDSYAIFLGLTQDGAILIPSMVDDIEICVGEGGLRFTYKETTVMFDDPSKQWLIWPTQEQTFAMEPGTHAVEIRVKYWNQNRTNVKGYTLTDKIKVLASNSREVL